MLRKSARRLARRAKTALFRDESFSIYAEDALVFAGLQPTKRGFYVDVGAHNPVDGSNTYRLYRKGWSGITIEPNPDAARAFKRRRPRDTHLVEGVSPTTGELAYYRFENSVMNTFSSERADHIQQHGDVMTGSQTVRTRPLREMVAQNCNGKHVDLLTIGCEGLDLEVLQSADLAHMRPTLVVVEDLPGYYAFRSGEGVSTIATYMRSANYKPVAQAFYSTLFVATDWRRLIELSPAFLVSQRSLLPEG